MEINGKKIPFLTPANDIDEADMLPGAKAGDDVNTYFFTWALIRSKIVALIATAVSGFTKGDTGATGAKGDQGIAGPKGDKGDRGDKGNTGLKGDTGNQGPAGIQGAKGDKGDKGDTGAQGVQGIRGVNTWGDIDGDISNQVDLKDALDSKLNASDYNQYFRGKYPSLSTLEGTLFNPPLKAGDNAQVDEGATELVRNYNWDDDNNVWVIGGYGSAATNTDQLPEGSNNLYFTSDRMIDAVNEAKKTFEKAMYVFAKLEVYFPMSAAGQITSVITDGLANVQFKVNASGTYGDSLPLTYSAGDRIYFLYGYSDTIYQEGSIILKGKDI